MKPKVATFDCYGTLVDWEGGAAAFLYDLARRSGDAEPGPGRHLRERGEEGRLPLHHRDPFDRMLIAQAQLAGLTIITRDAAFRAYDVPLLAA